MAAAVAAVEGQGGPRRMGRKKADRGAAAADHARPMPMRGAHGPQTDGPGYMGQGYAGRVGPDTVAALASLQGEPAGPPPPPGPATSSAAASSSSRQEALANFLQSMGTMIRAMDDARGQVVRPSSPGGTARARDLAGGPHLGANLVGRPNAPQLSCPRCILCTEESCDV